MELGARSSKLGAGAAFAEPPKPTGQRPVLPMLTRPNRGAVNGPTAHVAASGVGEAAFINRTGAKSAETGGLQIPSRGSRILRWQSMEHGAWSLGHGVRFGGALNQRSQQPVPSVTVATRSQAGDWVACTRAIASDWVGFCVSLFGALGFVSGFGFGPWVLAASGMVVRCVKAFGGGRRAGAEVCGCGRARQAAVADVGRGMARKGDAVLGW